MLLGSISEADLIIFAIAQNFSYLLERLAGFTKLMSSLSLPSNVENKKQSSFLSFIFSLNSSFEFTSYFRISYLPPNTMIVGSISLISSSI